MPRPRPGSAGRRRSPTTVFLLAPVLLVAVVTLALIAYAGIGLLWGYLIGINAATLLAYAYDKSVAPRGWPRVPERVLHALAAAGGTPAALAGQWLLCHKRSKQPFQVRFWTIATAQAFLLMAWLWANNR